MTTMTDIPGDQRRSSHKGHRVFTAGLIYDHAIVPGLERDNFVAPIVNLVAKDMHGQYRERFFELRREFFDTK